jgi:RNA 2',3'-cyclic 3'-phosphodiesterase
MTEARLRLFVGISIPEGQLRLLDRAVRPLRKQLPEARWADVANQHVTLKFLGWTDAPLLDSVRAEIEEVGRGHDTARIRLSGVGAFPNTRRARVVWAGIEDPGQLLTSLAASLDDRLARLGFEAEKRAYTPHLTLARIRHPRGVSLDSVAIVSEWWPVLAINLYRSHLSPRGARYEMLSSHNLGLGE